MEIQFISVCLRAAVKNEWGRGEQRHSEFYRPTAGTRLFVRRMLPLRKLFSPLKSFPLSPGGRAS